MRVHLVVILCGFSFLVSACGETAATTSTATATRNDAGGPPQTGGDCAAGPCTSASTVDASSGFVPPSVLGDSGLPEASSRPDATQDFEACAGESVEASPKQAPVNIVWVLDSSGSMKDEAAAVQSNMNAFAQRIAGAGIDAYRVVVISTSAFVKVPDPLGSDTKHFRFLEEDVGSHEPLQALITRYPDYEDFLLAQGSLHFIAVTDDESSLSADDFLSQMTALVGTSDFKLHAIASEVAEVTQPVCVLGVCVGGGEQPCSGAASPGKSYYAAAEQTGGLEFSICTSDWSGLFDKLGEVVSVAVPIPCELLMPDTMPGSPAVDPSLVNVLFRAIDATTSTLLPSVSSAADCASQPGWYYDDPETPTRMILCPSSCDQAEQGGALELKLGCQIELR